MEKFLLRLTFSVCVIFGAIALNSNSGGGFNVDYTGSPVGSDCTTCHSGTANSGSGSIQMTVPSNYYPGTQYSVSVNINQATNRNGFMATALRDNNANGGTFSSGTGSANTTISGRSYIRHNSASTTGAWSFNWTAPSFTDTIVFYYAGNASNSSFSTAGDDIYTSSTTIYPIDLITFTADTVNVTCNSGCDGELNISNVTGGEGAPYTYDWSNNAATASINNLCAGTYTLTITDNNGNEEVSMHIISEPDPLASNIAAIPSTCATGDGEVSASPIGGNGNYSYMWNTGSMDSIILNATIGWYYVTITDVEGCLTIDSVEVIEDGSGLNGAIVSNPENCGQANGTMEITMVQGNPPYSYAWSLGGNNALLTGVPAGVYQVTVTDDIGCTEVFADTVSETFANIDEVNTEVTPLTCPDIPSGSITVAMDDGIAPFTYVWDNSATGQTITNLLEGNYTVTATDDAGCTDVATFSVTEPDSIMASATATVENEGFCDGSISVTASGGTGSLSYAWSHDVSVTTSIATGLCAGEYTVTVSDVNSCNVVLTETVTSTTGITENDGVSINIYPNPTAGSVFLNGDLMSIQTIQMMDLTGRVMKRWNRFTNNELVFTGIESGRYMLLIVTDQGMIHKPVVLTR